MKQLYRIKFLIAFLLLFTWGLTSLKSQTCNDQTGKVIEQSNPESAACATYVARDNIRLLPGFQFSSTFQGKTQVVEFEWNYSGVWEGWNPNASINSTNGYGTSLPSYYTFDDFVNSVGELINSLSNQLGSDWTISYNNVDYSSQMVSFRVENNSSFSYSGNYANVNLVQSHEPAGNGIFNAKINEGLVVPVPYLLNTQIPDPNSRTIDKGLVVGSLPGDMTVSPSGAASYSFPIEVLPGLNGMEPTLSVSYNSQGGNGLLGWGWNLSGLSSVSRIPQTYYSDGTIMGVNLVSSDKYALDGNKLIVYGTGAYGADNTQYRTEMETFSKIVSHGSHNGPEWFEVQDKSGIKFQYRGNLLEKLASSSVVPYWNIAYAEDQNGNFIQYDYENVGVCSYLKKISYGCNKNNNTGNYNTIDFFYENRSDLVPIRFGSLKGNIDRVLYRVVVKAGNANYRQYNFEYTNFNDTDPFSRLVSITETDGTGKKYNPTVIKWGNYNSSEVSQISYSDKYLFPSNQTVMDNLTSISVGDYNGDGMDDAILNTYYETFAPGDYSKIIKKYRATFFESIDNNLNGFFNGNGNNGTLNLTRETEKASTLISDVVFGEFNGDGIQEPIVPYFDCDISAVNKAIFYRISKSSQTAICQTELVTKGSRPSISVADINNDGYSEIIIIENIYKSDILGYPGRIYYPKYNKWYTLNLSHYKIYSNSSIPPFVIMPGDYNGDGLADIIITDKDGHEDLLVNEGLYLPIGESINHVVKFSSSKSISIGFNNMDIIIPGDYNGDGLLDFTYCRKTSTTWKLALNNGNIGFNETVSNINIGINETQYYYQDPPSNEKVLVTDYNNDGKSDLVFFYLENGQRKIKWFKSTGSSFINQYSYEPGNGVDIRKISSGDFNGDGRPDILSGQNLTNENNLYPQLWCAPMNDNAGLVTLVANGLNQKTNINYRPLTDNTIYTKNVAASYPLVGIKAPLYVVSEYSKSNGIGSDQNSVSCLYENALVHLEGKGFIGFAKTTQSDNVSKIKNVTFFDPVTDIERNYFTLTKQTTEVYSFASSPEQKISKVENSFGYKLFSGKHIFYYNVGISSNNYLTNTTNTVTYTYDGSADVVPYNGKGNLIKEYKTFGGASNYEYTNYKEYTNAGSFIENKPRLIEIIRKNDSDAEYINKVRYVYDGIKGHITSKTEHEELASYDKIVTTYDYHPYYGIITGETITYPDKSFNPSTNSFSDISKTKSTSFDYTADGKFLKTITKPSGMVTEYDYDAFGSLTSEKTPDGFTTKYEYKNPFNSLSKTIKQDGTWSAIATSWVGEGAPANTVFSTIETAIASAPETRYFDLLGRELHSETVVYSHTSSKITTSYNSKGQIEWQTVPYFDSNYGTSKHFTYDDFGRPASHYYDNNEQTVTFEYIANSTKVKTTFAGTGRYVEKTTNVWGNTESIIDAKGNSTTYSYKSQGLPSSVTTAGVSTTMTYDMYGNQIELNDLSSAGKRSYLYNSIGQLCKQSDKKSKDNSIINVYDDLGRVSTQYIGVEYNGMQTVNYIYDTKIKGALSTVENTSNGTKAEYFYDTNNGRLTGITETINGKTFNTAYEYNDKGQLIKTTYPSGFKTLNEYDNYGYLISVKEIDGTNIWRATGRNAASGEVCCYSLGDNNKVRVSKNYDQYGVINYINTGNTDMLYSYDPHTRNLNGRQTFTKNLPTERFTYDELDRLKTWSNGRYNIDYSGITIANKSDAATGNFLYQTDTHKLDNIPGAVTDIQTPQYITYNAYNKIAYLGEYDPIASAGHKMNFTYDAFGERKLVVLKKPYNPTPILTRYYACGNYEQEERGSSIRKIDYIEGVPAIHVNNGGQDTIYYLHLDNQGSWLAVSNNRNATVKEQAFDPWGRRRDPNTWILSNSTNGFPFSRGYTGHEHLDYFGLINMNGRVYDPVVGMFLSPDPFVQAPEMPQNYNRYTYCLNNPLKYTDPSGEFWFLPVLIGAVGGYYLGSSIYMNNYNISSKEWWTGQSSAWKAGIVGAIGGAGLGLGVSSLGSSMYSQGYATSLSWDITSNALITANINIISTAMQGRDFDNIFKSGLVGLASGGIGGGLGRRWNKYSLGAHHMDQSAINATNYITSALNGFGDRYIISKDHGADKGEALLHGLIGAGEGLYLSHFWGNKDQLTGIKGWCAGNWRSNLTGRYLSGALTQAGTSVPGLGISIAYWDAQAYFFKNSIFTIQDPPILNILYSIAGWGLSEIEIKYEKMGYPAAVGPYIKLNK